VLLASPVALAFDSGGTGVPAQAAWAVVAFVLLGVLAVVAPWPLVERSWPLAALGGLAAFAGWTALSTSWSSALGDAVNDADRVVFYVAAFALAVVVMRAPEVRAVAPDALLWGIVIVSLYALAGRYLPDLVPVEPVELAGDRLAQPLTYWNAMGILTGFGALLATAVAANERRPPAYRAAACAAGIPCALACYLTFSRASWAAVVAGVAVLLLVRPRVSTAAAACLWAGSAILLATALRALPADPGESAFDAFPVAFVAIAVAVAFAFARFLREPHPDGTGGRLADSPPPRGPLAGSPALRGRLAAGVVAAVLAGGLAVSFAAERTEEISQSAERVTTLKTYRGDYWRVALGSFADNPVAGVGTAGFQVEWVRERDSRVFAFDAHSLYVETLAELGLVGFALLAAFIAAVAGGVRRAYRAGGADPVLAAAAAVLGAFAVHAGLDWDWEMPAVTLPALLLAAAAIQRP
jgi:hypothetical protein